MVTAARRRGGVRGPRRRFGRELICDRRGGTYLSKRMPYVGRAFCSGACRQAACRDRAKAEVGALPISQTRLLHQPTRRNVGQ